MASLTIHLTRLVLNHRQGPYELHRQLWRGFEAEQRPFLFRAEPGKQDEAPQVIVLVQSEQPGHWDRIQGVMSAEMVERRWTLTPGERYRFLLRANTTVSRKGRAEPATRDLDEAAFRAARGHRVALRGDEARLAWLHRHGEKAGFSLHQALLRPAEVAIPAVRVLRERTVQWSQGGHRATHEGCDFEGELVVRDPERLVAAVRSGIGPAKAFGFGMLSLGAAPLGVAEAISASGP